MYKGMEMHAHEAKSCVKIDLKFWHTITKSSERLYFFYNSLEQ